MKFQWCFKKELRVFEVSRVFQVILKGAASNLKGVSRVFERCSKGVSGKF